MPKPLVSVICPIHNGAHYFEKCIKSLLNQTLQDIEIILVDDASTDNSLQIIKEYKANFPDKITVVSYTDNKKAGGARNAGIKVASAEYIGFCDSDDFVKPTMYESLYNAIKKNDADTSVIQAAYANENDYPAAITNTGLSPFVKWNKNLLRWNDVDITGNALAHEDMIAYETGGVWSHLYKKKCIIENNVWFPEKISYEDNYFDSLLSVYLNRVVFVN